MQPDISTIYKAPTAWVDTSCYFSLQVYNKEQNTWFEIAKFGNVHYAKMVMDDLVKQYPFDLIAVWAMTNGESELIFVKGPQAGDFVRKDNEMKEGRKQNETK